MTFQDLQKVLSDAEIEPSTLVYLLRQSIQVEELKLEFHQAADCDTLDSYLKIMQGERFLTLLIAAGNPR
jgi:hypothetical protein